MLSFPKISGDLALSHMDRSVRDFVLPSSLRGTTAAVLAAQVPKSSAHSPHTSKTLCGSGRHVSQLPLWSLYLLCICLHVTLLGAANVAHSQATLFCLLCVLLSMSSSCSWSSRPHYAALWHTAPSSPTAPAPLARVASIVLVPGHTRVANAEQASHSTSSSPGKMLAAAVCQHSPRRTSP